MGYITNVVVKTRQTDATGVSMRKQIIYKAKLSYVRVVAKKSHWDSVFLSLVFVLFCDGTPRKRVTDCLEFADLRIDIASICD
jgi:hypothetical protein